MQCQTLTLGGVEIAICRTHQAISRKMFLSYTAAAHFS